MPSDIFTFKLVEVKAWGALDDLFKLRICQVQTDISIAPHVLLIGVQVAWRCVRMRMKPMFVGVAFPAETEVAEKEVPLGTLFKFARVI